MTWKPLSDDAEPLVVTAKTDSGGIPRHYIAFGCLGVSLLGLALVGLAFGWAAHQYEQAPLPVIEDRDGLINAVDLVGWTEGDVDVIDDWIDVEPFIFGAREWSYEAGYAENDLGKPWVYSVRTDDATYSDARTTYGLVLLTLRRRANGLGEGFSTENVSSGSSGRNKHTWYRIESPDGTVGALVVARRKRTTFGAIFGPVDWQDESDFDPRGPQALERAIAFTPSTEE